MPLKLLAPVAQAVDMSAIEARLAQVEQIADDGVAAGTNAQQMVKNRDTKLNQASTDATNALAETVTLQELAATLAQAIPASESVHAAFASRIAALEAVPAPLKGEKGDAGPQGLRGTDGAAGAKGDTGAKGTDGAAGVAGTANLAVGARPVGALALGGQTSITVVWSHAMPNTTYRIEWAHSAVVALSNVTITETARTTTSVTVTVKATGLALVAGTLIGCAL